RSRHILGLQTANMQAIYLIGRRMTTMVDQLEIEGRTETRNCEKHGDYEVKVISLFGSERALGYCEQCDAIEKASEAAKEQRRMTAMAADLSRRILPPR